jgi:transcriptional regulator with XRE-family HTH domain
MDQRNPITSPSYGDYLRALRERRGYKQIRDFAEAIYGDTEKPARTSQMANISSWECDRTTPRGSILGKIANALGVKPASINPKRYKPSMMKRMLLTMTPPQEISEPVRSAPDDGIIHEGGVYVPPSTEALEAELLPQPEESYGDYLRRVRLYRGFENSQTLREVAGITGKDVINRVENGLTTSPSEDTFVRLGTALGLPTSLVDPGQFKRIQSQGEDATETYGEYLIRLRRAVGFETQGALGKALAERFGLQPVSTVTLLSKWERGVSQPGGKNVIRLAQLYGVSALTLDPKRFVPGRLLPPTLKVVAPEPAPKETVDVENVEMTEEQIADEAMQTADVQWSDGTETVALAPAPTLKQEYGAMPQFLKQHVDVFGVSKTDDPGYVRIRFDAVLPKKTAGGLMRELVILTTDDLLGEQ